VVGVPRQRWLQIFVSGLILLYLVERTLLATSNANHVPSVILLGAFLVPVTFVEFLAVELVSLLHHAGESGAANLAVRAARRAAGEGGGGPRGRD
jgi:hypothetical protein